MANTDSAKFAYLTTISQRIPVSSEKIFMVTPIVDGKFEFAGTFNLESKKTYQFACVFVDRRGNISKEETLSKFRRLIWITGKTRNVREIILENLTLLIEAYGHTKDAVIVTGGKLSHQYDESLAAVRNGTVIRFIKKYPDSPVSFDQVVTVTSLTNPRNREKMASLYGTPNELFIELSLRQRTSAAGKALKKKIDGQDLK